MVPETTKRARDVLAAGLLAVVALELLVSFSLLFKDVGSNAGFAEKSIGLSGSFVDPVWILLVVVAILLVTHWGDPSRYARPLTLAGLAILGLALALGLITAIAALTSDSVDAFGSFGGRPFAGKLAGSLALLGFLVLTALAAWFALKTLTALPKPVRASRSQPQWGGQPGQQWGPPQGGQPGQQWSAQPGGQWGQPDQQWGQPHQQWGPAPGPGVGQSGGQSGGWGGASSAYEAQAWGQPAQPPSGQSQSGQSQSGQSGQGQSGQGQYAASAWGQQPDQQSSAAAYDPSYDQPDQQSWSQPQQGWAQPTPAYETTTTYESAAAYGPPSDEPSDGEDHRDPQPQVDDRADADPAAGTNGGAPPDQPSDATGTLDEVSDDAGSRSSDASDDELDPPRHTGWWNPSDH